MSGFFQELLGTLFGNTPKAPSVKPTARPRPSAPPRRPLSSGLAVLKPNHNPQQVTKLITPIPAPTRPSVVLLEHLLHRPPMPYWQLRRWRQVHSDLYIGYFKTRLGRCHGVIKWQSQYDFAFYVHDVPAKILNGPKGACFEMIKPGKYRVHFAQLPTDVNSGIFYIETLLQEAFKNG
jgi:hypothetical protein